MLWKIHFRRCRVEAGIFRRGRNYDNATTQVESGCFPSVTFVREGTCQEQRCIVGSLARGDDCLALSGAPCSSPKLLCPLLGTPVREEERYT